MKTGLIIAIICVVGIAIITVWLLMKRKNTRSDIAPKKTEDLSMDRSSSELINANQNDLAIRFETLSALSSVEEKSLVEITDKKLISRIDGVANGALQALANAGAVQRYHQAVEAAGPLYQAIIPNGAVLDKSRALEGAFRGTYHGTNAGYEGAANLLAVDANMGKPLAAMNVANTAMGIAAMVVGQYYMTQINGRLDSISDGIDKIASFQNNEYKSKVYVLVAEIQKCATFQMEIMENNELRKRELDHLQTLEHECAQLLAQANQALQEMTQKSFSKYKQYEMAVKDANHWYQYQQALLEILSKICELIYVLNLGSISSDYCRAMLLPFVKQAESTLEHLNTWHGEYASKFKIDIDAERRKRLGVGGFLMRLPAFLNDDWNYKSLSKQTAVMISNQILGVEGEKAISDSDFFQEDVRLIAKEGKLYYLPPA